MLRRQLVIAVSTILIFLGASAACSFDIEPGSQLAGQKCNADEDCAEGLVCSERICRPAAGDDPWGSGPDAGDPDGGDPDGGDPDGGYFEVGPPPVDVGVDTGPITCEPGATRCIAQDTYEYCVQEPGQPPQWISGSCDSGDVCEDGECVELCPDGWEYNPITGECVPPDDPCCEGGCADDEICHDCSCVSYTPQNCQYQDQPCDHPGQGSGQFWCTDWDGITQPRCMAFCDPQAPDPDATCPGDSTFCSYEDPSDFEGLCLTSCAIDDPCADDQMSCIYFDATPDDGVCYPVTGSGEPGDPCDDMDPFSCAGSALCIEGTCMQSCRPFADDGDTDCVDGYCLPFDDNLGVCSADASDGQGGCTQEGATCGEDATGCFPSQEPGMDLQCNEFCRLQEDDDCSDDQEMCHRFDQQNDVLGICGPGFTTQ